MAAIMEAVASRIKGLDLGEVAAKGVTMMKEEPGSVVMKAPSVAHFLHGDGTDLSVCVGLVEFHSYR
jgi:hypothetical protein